MANKINNVQELRLYLEHNTNYGALKRMLSTSLYNQIINSWSFDHKPVSFLENVYQYLTPTDIICPYGNRKRFEYFRTGYICKKSCKCSYEKFEKTMVDRYGVTSALQSKKIYEKFKKTMVDRYGDTSISRVFKDKREDTNIKKYGFKTPLESPSVRQKSVNTHLKNTGFENPFHQINNSDNQKQYIDKRNKTRRGNHPPKVSDEIIKEYLEKMSYVKASQELGVYMPYLKSVVVRNGWDHLLPKKSSYEEEIKRFLNDCGINYISNSRSIISPYELDFYIEELNLAIEFHGLRWHTELTGGKDKFYHVRKMEMCRDKNIRLIQIFEDEWLEKSDIIKQLIIQYKDALVVPARKCYIQEIKSSVAFEFCQNHHLQGGTRVKINYGLFHDGMLIAVMTFKRIKANNFEMSRYCVHEKYRIIGGASKLLKKFKNEIAFDKLLTYSDNRYFTGNVYDVLGFDSDGETGPNYWYVKNIIREHRLRYTKTNIARKFNIDLTNKTEWEAMQELGYDRIWDCGSKRWIMTGEKL